MPSTSQISNRRARRRWAQHAVVLAILGTAVSAGLGAMHPEGGMATAEYAGVSLAMRPIEPEAPIEIVARDRWAIESAPATWNGGTAENDQPVVTVSAPLWLRTTQRTSLWASHDAEARAFTDVPTDSLLRVEGPAHNGRWPVYYVGDGLTRRAGGAWVDGVATEAIDAPAPGDLAEVDAYAKRPLPTWVQAHRATGLWSGPDAGAVKFSDLPQWSYLRVAGVARDGRLLVEYAGDFATRMPGVGWIDETAVGPAGDPGQWVQNHRVSNLYSGPDANAQRFTDVPQWTRLRVVDSSTTWADRILVEYYGDNATRLPGVAWVPRADLGPITPPNPLPAALRTNNPGSQGTTAATGQRTIQTRTFTSEADFVNTVGEAARRSQVATGVPASVTVAQAILESDWGRSRLTRTANNLFGIKALSGPGPAGTVSLPTWEHLDGQDVIVQAAFRAYYTLDESVEDHGRFFLRNRRYAAAMSVAADPKAFARAIQEAGYATDPGYAAKLIRLMDRYDLYRFDAR